MQYYMSFVKHIMFMVDDKLYKSPLLSPNDGNI